MTLAHFARENGKCAKLAQRLSKALEKTIIRAIGRNFPDYGKQGGIKMKRNEQATLTYYETAFVRRDGKKNVLFHFNNLSEAIEDAKNRGVDGDHIIVTERIIKLSGMWNVTGEKLSESVVYDTQKEK